MKTEDYKFRTELHLHTNPVSGCSEIPPEEAVKRYADIGYNSIVLTNHYHNGTKHYGNKQECVSFYLNDYEKAAEAGDKYNVKVIIGCEIRFANESFNDYLIYGIDRDFFYKAYDYLEGGIEKFSKDFRDGSLLLLQAHPFRDGMVLADPSLLDGVETFNMHPNHNSRVGFAQTYAKEHNMITSAGTDFHHAGHEGMAAMLTEKEMTNSFEIAEALRSKNRLFEIGRSAIVSDN